MKSFISRAVLPIRNFALIVSALLTVSIADKAAAQGMHFPVRDVNNIVQSTQLSTTATNNVLYIQNDQRGPQVNDASFPSKVKYKSNLTMVRMAINHAAPKRPSLPYVYKMMYQINGSSTLNDTTYNFTANDSLVIGFNPDSLTAYQDQQVKVYQGLYNAKVTILQFYEVSGAQPQLLLLDTVIKKNFSVELAMQYQPYLLTHYTPTQMDVSASSTFDAPTSMLKVSWSPNTTPYLSKVTPAQYEFEWTYSDNYKADGTEMNIQDVAYNFKNNATRITTDSLFYSIPVIYPKGYIVYRIRMVRPDMNLYEYPIYGVWSLSNTSGAVSGLSSNDYYKVLTAHTGDSLNWNYSIQFAEGGKFKHVVSYYDGMLKNRQTITRFNSKPSQLLVTENIYDYEGRPSITTLPSVVNSSAFRYQDSVSMNTSGAPYSAVDFDTRPVSCPDETPIPPFLTASRANRYYSALNTDTTGAQKFLPRANGYPFVHTQLSAGFSDRVDKQGGAGDSLQINRGHDVRNEYATADAANLNALFGLNAGFASYYTKTVSKDQNGQYSMSLKDFRGKPVATALIGAAVDTSTHAIMYNEEVPNNKKFKEDKLANALQSVVGHQKIWGGNIYMDEAALTNVTYEYNFQPYQVCASPYIGLSVKGDYDYTIHDACGQLELHKWGTLGVTGVTTNSVANPFSQTTATPLIKGNHTINKTLTIATDEIYAAVDSFFAYHPSCAKTEDDFIKDAVEATAFPCPGSYNDPCAQLEADMMAELWPKHKYGFVGHQGNVITGNDTSIFDVIGNHPDGNYSGYYRYQAPCVATALSGVSVNLYGHLYSNLGWLPTDTFEYVYEHLDQTQKNLIAHALLPLHPEYCRLQGCFVDTFENRLKAIPDAAAAMKLGMFNLDSLVAKDVLLTSKLIVAPFNLTHIYDSLKTMMAGTVRMDTLAAQFAFCSTDDSLAFSDAKQIFHAQIVGLNFPDTKTRNNYFEKLRAFYLFNRDKWKNIAQTGGGNSCSPCDSTYKLHLKNPPLAPQIYNINGSFATGPGSMLSLFSPNMQAGINYFVNSGNGTQITNPDTIQHYQDSATHAVLHADTLLSMVNADSIVARLANCFPSQLSRTRMYDTLVAMFIRGEVHNGVYLPNQVRYAIVASGNSLNDLCHPYLFNYDYYQDGIGSGGACKSGAFYTDVKNFLNEPQLISALISATASPSTSPFTSGTAFAQLIGSQLGGSIAAVTTQYQSTSKTYRLAFSGGGANTVTISLRSGAMATVGSNSPVPLFQNAGSLNLDNVACYFEDPQASADGHIGAYMFRVHAVRTDAVNGSTQTTQATMNGWTDGSVEMNESGDNELAACVPCTQFKTIFKDFRDTMLAYGGFAADHPTFMRSLRNFSNFNFKRVFSDNQYNRFLQSCAFGDSMLIPAYGGWAKYAGNFSVLQTSVQTALGFSPQPYIDYTAGGSESVIVDNNSIPYGNLRDFKNTSGLSIATPVPGSIATLWVPDSVNGQPFSNVSLVLNGVAFSAGAATSVTVNQIGVLQAYHKYVLTAAAGATPQQISTGIAGIRNNLYNNNIQGYVVANALATVNSDYYKAEKQQYLSYTYSAQLRPTPKVLDTVQDFNLVANVGAFSGNDVSYTNATNPTRFTDLYYTNSANVYPGFQTLTNIINWSKVSLGNGNTNICMSPATNTVVGSGATTGTLMLYRCSDGLYWYRYFDAYKHLYNVYIRIPQYVYQSVHPTFTVAAIRPTTGDSATRSFTALLQSTAMPNDTVYAAGTTDFDIAWSNKLKDVLMGDERQHAQNPPPASGEVGSLPNCEQDMLINAIDSGRMLYHNYIDSFKVALKAAFYAHVMNGASEKLWIEYIDKRFAYTLYNYDLAGNLIRTVPPEGVQQLDSTHASFVDGLRSANQYAAGQVPQHRKVSSYEFSTVNKPLREVSPDGGVKNIYYDAKGNVILSQNDKQRKTGLFTYSLYDGQNRVIETGEMQWNNCPVFADQRLYQNVNGTWVKTASPSPCACENLTDSVWTYCMPFANTNFYNDSAFKASVYSMSRTQVVATVYDFEAFNLGTLPGQSRQKNLRSRVSANMYFESCAPGVPPLTNGYVHATHYSYDASGNVNTLVQDFPELAGVGQRYKRVDYEYDLHSGKVNMLAYNRGYADQMYQKYQYDADNRITKVETSHDGFIWKRDAEYSYYQHGPLARLSLGDQRVQGMDYAYTIQGWLKTINGGAIDTTLDMGRDGWPDSTITPKDAFATEINYFNGDYNPIGGTAFSQVPGQTKNLYNGNIARQTTDLAPFGALTAAYTYDQMNRLRNANYATIKAGVLAFNSWYASTYKYDLDGNLKALTRHAGVGSSSEILMDSFTYSYPNAQNNKLADVLDYANFSASGYEDLKLYTVTGGTRLFYDEIGNVIKDKTSNTDTVGWNIYGKTTDIANNTQKWTMHMGYDGAGQRVSKSQAFTTDTGKFEQNTYYARDATGNILAEYELKRSWDTGGKVTAISDVYQAIDQSWVAINGFANTNAAWLSNLSGLGYLTVPSFAKAMISSAGGPSIATLPAGYFFAQDAALTSHLLQSGEAVLPAMMRYSNQTAHYPIADAIMDEIASGDPQNRLTGIARTLITNPSDSLRHRALGQMTLLLTGFYDQVNRDLGIDSATAADSVKYFSILDKMAFNKPDYYTQYILSRYNNDPQQIYPGWR